MQQEMTDNGDRPTSFGYMTAWFAVRSTDPRAVAAAIELQEPRPSSWSAGIDAACVNGTFVTPCVDGWVFVVGTSLGYGIDTGQGPWQQLTALSSRFGEAQFFCTHRVVEMHVWAKAVAGELVRAFGYLGERGETLFDEGEPSAEEQDLGFRFFDERSPEADDDAYWERDDLAHPDEESVMAIARRWSLAPIDLSEASAVTGSGLLGAMPGAAERARQAEELTRCVEKLAKRPWWRFW